MSRLMFKCVRPASFNWGSFLERVTPLVVMATDSMPSVSERDPDMIAEMNTQNVTYKINAESLTRSVFDIKSDLNLE